MAWADIRYQCGHGARVQMYGPERERQARLWSYSQKLCRECWVKAAKARDDGAPATPQAHRRRISRNPPLAEVIVYRGFDAWGELMARGYRMREDLDENPYSKRDPYWFQGNDRVEFRSGPPPLFKGWVKEVHSQFELDEEWNWLRDELGAMMEPPKPVAARDLPLPSAFADIKFEPGMRDRVAVASDVIRKALARAGQPFISFSGGKDSIAMMHLVHAVDPSVPMIWADDELEFPETVAYMEALRERVGDRLIIVHDIHYAHAGWFVPWQDAEPFRPPFPLSVRIDELKTWAQADGYDLTFLGLRGDENKRRGAFLAEAGPTYRRRYGLVCAPLHDWGDDDVWRFIYAIGAPYNAAYDRYREMNLDRPLWRVGPLPLAPRDTLAEGWPDLLARLEARYGQRWS